MAYSKKHKTVKRARTLGGWKKKALKNVSRSKSRSKSRQY